MKKKILNLVYKILAAFSRLYIKRTKPFVIGITGSVWKTSCRTIISQILQQNINNKVVYTSPKNYNSELGIVLSIFTIENYNPSIKNLFFLMVKIFFQTFFCQKKYDIIVLEYGVDHKNDMDFLLSIVKPDIWIFTKLDFIHVKNFSSKEEIGNEKFKLFLNTKNKVYINSNDEFLRQKAKEIPVKYEFFDKNYTWKYIKENNKIYAEIKYKDKKIITNILWEENFDYIILGINILEKDLWYKFKTNKLFFQLLPGRFSIFEWIKNSIIIDSSYNAWPESMKAMIKNTLNLQKIFPDYKILFVIWDMRELWDFSYDKHKEIFDILRDKWEIITIWDETKKAFKWIKNFKNSKKLGFYLKDFLTKSSDKYIILFKWSQNTIFLEEAIKEILKNKEDIKHLPRQENYWIKKKFTFK
jgi:UDP-N-acetylmuramoyl-tripeptide--D-alanyl-D-alanine ligase